MDRDPIGTATRHARRHARLGDGPHICILCGCSDPVALIDKTPDWLEHHGTPKSLFEQHHPAGRPPNRAGDRDCVGLSALSRFYRCRDGWLAIAAREPGLLCEALGIPEASALETSRDGALASAVAAALENLDRAAARERLGTHKIPALPALKEAELFHDPAHQPERFFHVIDHPDFDSVTLVRSFAEWSRSTSGFTRRPPLLGEHGEEILRQFGFDTDRIARLRDARALR